MIRVFIPFATGFFLSYVFRAVNSVIARDLVAELGLDPAQLGLLTSVYFLAFIVTQVPLGIALDRWGGRRVESALLLVAAVGAVVFSRAVTLTELVIGRALIGLGVSACLMAPFKAYAHWVPRRRLSLVNGLQLAAGGLGAMTASYPVQLALRVTTWRGVFLGLAGFTVLVAGLIHFVVPRGGASDGVTMPLAEHVRQMRAIYTNRVFLRIAPWAAGVQATFMAVQGLWAGPWLLDVGGYSREATALILLFLAAGMIAGYISIGMLSDLAHARGISPVGVLAAGLALFTVTLLALTMNPGRAAPLLWVFFGYIGTSGALAYAVLSRNVAPEASGKVNTAHNLLVFVLAFPAQWGVGGIIRSNSAAAGAGGFAPQGYRTAFLVLVGVLLLGALQYTLGFPRQMNREGTDSRKPPG